MSPVDDHPDNYWIDSMSWEGVVFEPHSMEPQDSSKLLRDSPKHLDPIKAPLSDNSPGALRVGHDSGEGQGQAAFTAALVKGQPSQGQHTTPPAPLSSPRALQFHEMFRRKGSAA